MLTLVTCPICKKRVALNTDAIDFVRREFYTKHSSVKRNVCEASFLDYRKNDTAESLRRRLKP